MITFLIYLLYNFYQGRVILLSKLYKKYVLLKIKNPKKIYLFECGIFYIFIDEDAKYMGNILNLKLTQLNSVVVKCGFPIKSADKYFNILKNYNIEIVPSTEELISSNINNYLFTQNANKIIQNFLNKNIDALSISEAFDVLNNLQKDLKEIYNNETKK